MKLEGEYSKDHGQTWNDCPIHSRSIVGSQLVAFSVGYIIEDPESGYVYRLKVSA